MTSQLQTPLPTGWEQKRLRFVLDTNPIASQAGLEPDLEVSFIPMDAVGEMGGLRLDQKKAVDDIGSGYTYFADNDVVVAKITPCFENGKAALAKDLLNGVAFGTTELHVLRAMDGLSPEFLFYLIISDWFRNQGEASMYGAGGQKRVPERFIKDLVAYLPPPDEQQAIVCFLAERIGKIDALIAHKQGLLNLLAEKRSALITQAVTKGLDPSAPLKPSGVEWLGEIPTHWEVKRLKFLSASVKTGRTPPTSGIDYFEDEGINWYTPGDFNNLILSNADKKLSFEALKDEQAILFEAGSVLMVGIGATLGKIGISHSSCSANQQINAIKTNDLISNYFLSQYLSAFIKEIKSLSSSSTLGIINQEKTKSITLAVPPIIEQQAIVAYLDEHLQKLDAIKATLLDAIERLKEYRAALITSAVTGKIDVRSLQPKEALSA